MIQVSFPLHSLSLNDCIFLPNLFHVALLRIGNAAMDIVGMLDEIEITFEIINNKVYRLVVYTGNGRNNIQFSHLYNYELWWSFEDIILITFMSFLSTWSESLEDYIKNRGDL